MLTNKFSYLSMGTTCEPIIINCLYWWLLFCLLLFCGYVSRPQYNKRIAINIYKKVYIGIAPSFALIACYRALATSFSVAVNHRPVCLAAPVTRSHSTVLNVSCKGKSTYELYIGRTAVPWTYLYVSRKQRTSSSKNLAVKTKKVVKGARHIPR